MKIFAGIAEHEFVSLEVTFLFPYIHFPVIPYLLHVLTNCSNLIGKELHSL